MDLSNKGMDLSDKGMDLSTKCTDPDAKCNTCLHAELKALREQVKADLIEIIRKNCRKPQEGKPGPIDEKAALMIKIILPGLMTSTLKEILELPDDVLFNEDIAQGGQ